MKCFHCKKKIVILIECKCKNSFCIKHLNSTEHNCPVEEPLHEIEKIEPPSKIEKI